MQKIDKIDMLKTILSGRKYTVDYFQRDYRWGRNRLNRRSLIFRVHSRNIMIPTITTLQRIS